MFTKHFNLSKINGKDTSLSETGAQGLLWDGEGGGSSSLETESGFTSSPPADANLDYPLGNISHVAAEKGEARIGRLGSWIISTDNFLPTSFFGKGNYLNAGNQGHIDNR